ncbi:MAG: transcriptional regulator, partial [Streptomyces sp.]
DVTHHNDLKRYRHPELGELELYCQRLIDPDQAQELLVFSATPGTPSHEKLQLLPAVGGQAWHDPTVLRRDFP